MKDGRQIKVRDCILTLDPYVPGKPVEEVERELGLKDAVKLASNENLFGPSPMALQAIQEALVKINFYPDANCFYLKNDLAEHLGVKPENLIIGNGSDELLKMIAETFVCEGDEAVMAWPSFVEYVFTTRLMAGKCVQVPLRDYTHDLKAMAAAINPRTRLVFICNPNNPTGTMVSKSEVEEFLASIPDDVVVIMDEAYREYVSRDDYPDSLELIRQGYNVIALRTFSKIYGLAGIRVGYGIAREDLIAHISRVKEPFNVNSLAQVGARACLRDREHVARVKEETMAGREYLYRELTDLGLSYVPTETNFLLVDTGRDSRQVFQALLREGVIVRSGDIFGLPAHVRVTIGGEEENRRFVEALARVLDVTPQLRTATPG